MESADYISHLSKAIRERRERLGITQKALSELSGVSFRTVQSIESGNAFFSVKNLCLIADALGLKF